jgi:uncharacterized membrane protein YfcA
VTRLVAGALVGIVAGLLSGAAGLGGAIISTPGIRALGAPPLIAVGTTVPAIIVASASGSWNYLKSRNCDLSVAMATALTGVVFTILGAAATKVIAGRLLMLATASLVIYGGGRILLGRTAKGQGHQESEQRRSLSIAAGIGVVAGFLSGSLGIGGGIVMLPAYFRFLKMPIKQTTGTSLVVAGILAVPGTLMHWRLGNIDWRLAAGLSIGALVGSYVGSRLTVRSRERRVQTYIGALLVVIGATYAILEIVAWIRAT